MTTTTQTNTSGMPCLLDMPLEVLGKIVEKHYEGVTVRRVHDLGDLRKESKAGYYMICGVCYRAIPSGRLPACSACLEKTVYDPRRDPFNLFKVSKTLRNNTKLKQQAWRSVASVLTDSLQIGDYANHGQGHLPMPSAEACYVWSLILDQAHPSFNGIASLAEIGRQVKGFVSCFSGLLEVTVRELHCTLVRWDWVDLDQVQWLRRCWDQSKHIAVCPRILHCQLGLWDPGSNKAALPRNVKGWMMQHCRDLGWLAFFQLFPCRKLPGRICTAPRPCESFNQGSSYGYGQMVFMSPRHHHFRTWQRKSCRWQTQLTYNPSGGLTMVQVASLPAEEHEMFTQCDGRYPPRDRGISGQRVVFV
jgi:hypothetical protein